VTTPHQRRAEFVCTLCVLWPDGTERVFEGRAPGHLSGRRAEHWATAMTRCSCRWARRRTFAELDPAEKNKISHRARALEKLVRDLF
jgi:XTP/dITP diphosphohydrolase